MAVSACCPKCGNADFDLVVKMLVPVSFEYDPDGPHDSDYGNQCDLPHGDVEYDDATDAICRRCGWCGTLGQACAAAGSTMHPSLAAFYKEVTERWPDLFIRSDADFCTRPAHELYISGEFHGGGKDPLVDGRRLFDYYAFEHDPHEKHYVCGVHREVLTIADKYGVLIEWRDAASLGVYPN